MIRVRVSQTDRDNGWREFKKAMKAIKGDHVTVGVHEGAGSYPNGTSVGQVALWNEFGTINSPERSFVRSAIDENMGKITAWTVELVAKVEIGEISMAKALETLGFRVQVLIQNKITSGDFEKNAPSTLASKARAGAGSMPLQWTRLLLRSVGYKVRAG